MRPTIEVFQAILQFIAEAEDLEDGKTNALRSIERLGAGTSIGMEATAQLESGLFDAKRLTDRLCWFPEELRGLEETKPGLVARALRVVDHG